MVENHWCGAIPASSLIQHGDGHTHCNTLLCHQKIIYDYLGFSQIIHINLVDVSGRTTLTSLHRAWERRGKRGASNLLLDQVTYLKWFESGKGLSFKNVLSAMSTLPLDNGAGKATLGLLFLIRQQPHDYFLHQPGWVGWESLTLPLNCPICVKGILYKMISITH